MKYLLWLLKAAIFFTLFAFALNNQQDATVHFFFGTRWTAPAVLIVPSRDTAQPRQQVVPPSMQTPSRRRTARTEEYYDTKSQVFSALIDTIDLSQLSKLGNEAAREEIRDIVNDIITIKNFAMSISEQEELLEDICNDVLGYGPLEPLLARDREEREPPAERQIAHERGDENRLARAREPRHAEPHGRRHEIGEIARGLTERRAGRLSDGRKGQEASLFCCHADRIARVRRE